VNPHGPERRSQEALWDVRDVARFLKASVSWVYKAAERGDLPSTRIGGLLRFDPGAVRAVAVGLSDSRGSVERTSTRRG
jgi:excisionase family DNA binding protein